jgi:two-component system, response regulator YesN
MNLYRIMVVDDEEEIRLGIIKKIDWEANDRY